MTSGTHWERIDWPVLKAIWELELEQRESRRRGRGFIDGSEIEERSGVSSANVSAALDNLGRAGLVDDDGLTLAETHLVRGVTPTGLQALGEWPTGDALADVLPELLALVADRTEDDDQAAVLKRGADILQGVATGTLAAILRQVLGLDA